MQFLVILGGCLIADLFGPWYIGAPIAFFGAFLLVKSPNRSFVYGGIAVGLSWLLPALVDSIANRHILAMRMTAFFSLPHISLLFTGAFLIGGLLGGLSALAGSYARMAVLPVSRLKKQL
jgi:hypothetical protein